MIVIFIEPPQLLRFLATLQLSGHVAYCALQVRLTSTRLHCVQVFLLPLRFPVDDIHQLPGILTQLPL